MMRVRALAPILTLSLWQRVGSFTTVASTTSSIFVSRAALATPPSCSIGSDDSFIDSDIAEDDGGRVPTKEEQAAIDDAISNTYLPDDLPKEPSEELSQRNDNSELFELLLEFANLVKIQDPVDLNEDIDFSKYDPEKCMYHYVKPIRLIDNLGLSYYKLKLHLAPSLKMNIDTCDMPKERYTEILGKLVLPLNMMKASSPVDCFMENAPAFCAPVAGNDEVSVCNLDYLTKYQVKRGSLRYGGKALVKGGEIIEISGYQRSDPEFDEKLNIFLSSFGVHVVLVHHALMGHLAIYQKYMMRLTSKRSEAYQNLWMENKSAGFLLKALTPRATNSVNWRIQNLIGPHKSLIGRATSFTKYSIMHLNRDKYNEFYHMEPDAVVEEIGSKGSMDWNLACQTAWMAAQRCVNIICRDIRAREELKDTDLRDLAMLLWTGTFYHGFVGDFQLDNVIKGNLPFLATGNKHRQTLAYGTLSTVIGATTSQRTMDMNTLGKFFSTEEDREAWKEYHQVLAACAKISGIKGFSYDDTVYNAIDF
mmetsp:Transcript_30998/g.65994  ORF Transcript_30998/g.65994 Transcript_30998/m.65994 type:complete len:535 (-) Transcript_30998:20-1624(-)